MLIAAPAGLAFSQQSSALDRGRAVYVENCAGCHGVSGTGYGPAAAVLTRRPPDLTRYSDHKTPFPRAVLRNVITGRIRLAPAHRRIEMPSFRADAEPLLDYLEHIQARPFGSPLISAQDLAAAGEVLFRVHCASCHSAGGNLTTIAARHGGFDLTRVIELIARCDNGKASGMPAWRAAPSRAGRDRALANANLSSLAHYVQSIQRQ